ncbi:unnamed protein product [Owenia fusiformis]|uniref:Transporter n=1 Tax=Owenia fusiformis TaxID=6347 RepID=A0A8J1URF5_OWEFU|nr:unnamed protein product [Owenia fusiformis]
MATNGTSDPERGETATCLANTEGDNDNVSENEEEERPSWDSKVQFLMSVISYAVGLGNVWRFPYLCQKNGGGAFLIPYFIMLIAEGIPLFYLELSIGQTLRMGSVGVWNEIHPYLGGVGYASTIVSFIVGLYYNVIIMWCLWYFANSFMPVLPWGECPMEMIDNVTSQIVPECAASDAPSYFWYRETLDITSGIDEAGGLKWKLLLCLLGAWLVVYICMCKGIKSSGKVVYFTATFPYVVLIIFFGRGVTLKGAGAGLLHMFTPRMERLADPVVWLDAATQIFYSLGLAFGGLIAFASYNPPKNNCKRDAILVSITNCTTSIFASIVIFSVLGYKATSLYDTCIDRNIAKITAEQPHLWNNETILTPALYERHYAGNSTNATLQMSIDLKLEKCDLQENLDSAASGTGLAFMVFTAVINQFPVPQFWSVIFFLMLLSLGLGSQMGTLEGVATSISDMAWDKYPWMRKKPIVAGILCLVSFTVGLIFVLGSGNYWLDLFDSFSGTFPLMTVAFFEVIGVVYIYGMESFTEDIKFMTGAKPGWYWVITWRFVSPILMFIVLVASIISKLVKPITYSAYDKETASLVDKYYPWWASLCICFLVLSSILCIPGVAIVRKIQDVLYLRRNKGEPGEMQLPPLDDIAEEGEKDSGMDLEAIDDDDVFEEGKVLANGKLTFDKQRTKSEAGEPVAPKRARILSDGERTRYKSGGTASELYRTRHKSGPGVYYDRRSRHMSGVSMRSRHSVDSQGNPQRPPLYRNSSRLSFSSLGK